MPNNKNNRKAILLDTHADICKLLVRVTIRSVDLRDSDLTHFRSLQRALLNCQKMLEVMLDKGKKNESNM